MGEIVKIRRGLTYKPSDICENGIRVLRSSNIDGDSFVLNCDDVFVREQAVNIDYARENDILITAANGSSRLVGKHAILSQIPDKSTVHGGFMLLGSTEEPYFINASMGSSWYRRFVELFVAGGNGAIGNLNKNDLDNQDIFVPSKKEQTRIGTFFRQLDRLVTLHQCNCNMATRPCEWSSGLRAIAWEQRKLGEVGTTFTGLSGKKASDFGHGKASLITYMNVFSNPIANPNMIENVEVDSRQREVEVGDVFFTTSSETPEEVGMSSVLKKKIGITYLNSFCFGFRPSVKFDLDYLAFMLRSESVRKQIKLLAQGISRFNIAKTKMMYIDIQVPKIDEQIAIGKYFAQLDRLITLHQRKHILLT